ncbi:MAG TPA: Gfo/Idh/MocA family oxidoreductase, partial [Aggregatilineales bacterium]|nr:Gfo/Idh/MocA family oxidoreductase [Aggregatilineales bacterium]
MKVGIIGTGNIAPAYMKGCGAFPEDVQVAACADLMPERAAAFASTHNLQALSIDELLAHDEIELIINLTIPVAHSQVNHQVIAAGKHVYGEKPLALTRAEGRQILEAAQAKGVRVGCAPDTFLGAGGQTCRKIIDSGAIGEPIAAIAMMASHGPENWHPNPFFYYQPGGGPMLDMGPYYLSFLVYLMGAITGVSATTKRTFAERVAGHESIRGQVIPVDVNTHAAGTVTFASGAIGTIIMSFDVWKHNLPRIEIYGTEGSLSVPDPNRFDGTAQVWDRKSGEWHDAPMVGRDDVQRGIGVADMARAIQNSEPHRLSGALAYHVLDAMEAFEDSSREQRHITLTST